MDISEDKLIQDELEILWGDRLTVLTPRQRKMVAEILRQTKRQPNFNSSRNFAIGEVDFYIAVSE